MFSFNQKTYLLLTIIIIFIIFFICGILHLLIKHFLKPINIESEEIASTTAFQGQLQQLFHLHDDGVDQSFIDSLPIFLYKSIIGLKDPFDCVVCLCEFELCDKLRLLPNCSHAFHIGCIDTWLLSHSTCPLCRRSLLPQYSSEGSSNSTLNVEDDFAHSRHEVGVKDDFAHTQCVELQHNDQDELNLHHVKLGKFRNVEVCEEGTSKGKGELKERCFSMGAIEYVMNERSLLQVVIKPLKKKQPNRINEGGSARISDKYYNKEAFSFRFPKHISDLG